MSVCLSIRRTFSSIIQQLSLGKICTYCEKLETGGSNTPPPKYVRSQLSNQRFAVLFVMFFVYSSSIGICYLLNSGHILFFTGDGTFDCYFYTVPNEFYSLAKIFEPMTICPYTPPQVAQIYRLSKNGFYLTQQRHTKLPIRTLIHNIMPDVLVGV